MIGVSLFSPNEVSISDYTREQSERWSADVVDYRDFLEVGKIGIEIFDLGHSHIFPTSLSAKMYRSGTSVVSKIRVLMSNGDLIESKRSEIYTSLERDCLQQLVPTGFVTINGKKVDTRDFNFYPSIPDFDSLKDFYINYWIPFKNKEILETLAN
jgi:hypothetical protein